MLFTKSILKPKSHEDGIRISVMSRHTLNDGITPNPKISSYSYDTWLKELAPPSKLIRDYLKNNVSWDLYAEKYLEFLNQENISKKIQQLAKRALKRDITLLCIEDKADYCHRKLLAEECQRYETDLVIENK